jgi:SAM-dependent methyltransferase
VEQRADPDRLPVLGDRLGHRAVLLLYMAITWLRGNGPNMPCVDTMARYLLYAFIIDFSLELLDLSPGLLVLDVGVGTGREHLHIQESISPAGVAYGLDLSGVMLDLCRQRTGASGPSRMRMMCPRLIWSGRFLQRRRRPSSDRTDTPAAGHRSHCGVV